MNPVVSFKNVQKSYGTDPVLKGISFDVFKGNVVALIGQSGSGKSTALRCINGLEQINEGELHVCGRSEEHTSELQSLMRISYAVFCLKKKKEHTQSHRTYVYKTTQTNRHTSVTTSN